jgi:hypothetical protein
VVSNGGDAIDISTPGVNVALRNLNIIPLIVGSGTPGMRGVFLQAGSSLIVENCLIANINGDGIDVNSATSVNLRVASSTVRGNNGIGIGILGVNTAVTTTFDVIDTNIDGNTGAGMNIGSLTANAAIKGAVRNSRISQNGYNGITLESDASAIVTVTVSHTSITNNATTGILSNLAPTKVFVAGSTIAGNGGVGLWAAGGGIVESAGNNEVRNNDGGNATGITAPGLM